MWTATGANNTACFDAKERTFMSKLWTENKQGSWLSPSKNQTSKKEKDISVVIAGLYRKVEETGNTAFLTPLRPIKIGRLKY